jgi:hypothetical protein
MSGSSWNEGLGGLIRADSGSCLWWVRHPSAWDGLACVLSRFTPTVNGPAAHGLDSQGTAVSVVVLADTM